MQKLIKPREYISIYLFVETSTRHFVKAFFIHRLEILDVAELEENACGSLRKRKRTSRSHNKKLFWLWHKLMKKTWTLTQKYEDFLYLHE